MAVLPICISGSSVLHTPALEVTEFTAELDTLIADMYETMDRAPGVGLAAPQVGVPLRVFTYSWTDEDGTDYRGVAINPELLISPSPVMDPEEADEEGCLSFPGERFPLIRSEKALLRARDAQGKPYELSVSGWIARIFQHEFDHLDGILYVDRLDETNHKHARKIARKRAWAAPGKSWMPGVDNLEG